MYTVCSKKIRTMKPFNIPPLHGDSELRFQQTVETTGALELSHNIRVPIPWLRDYLNDFKKLGSCWVVFRAKA